MNTLLLQPYQFGNQGHICEFLHAYTIPRAPPLLVPHLTCFLFSFPKLHQSLWLNIFSRFLYIFSFSISFRTYASMSFCHFPEKLYLQTNLRYPHHRILPVHWRISPFTLNRQSVQEPWLLQASAASITVVAVTLLIYFNICSYHAGSKVFYLGFCQSFKLGRS